MPTEKRSLVFVSWGHGLIQTPRDGETHRSFIARTGKLRLRCDGELDMRFRTSQAIAASEA